MTALIRLRNFRKLVVLLGAVFCSGCAARRALGLRVEIVEDTVRLRRFPEGVALDASAMVKNQGPRAIYIIGCGPSAERQIGKTWVQVFAPVCLSGNTRVIAGTDSAVIPINLYGFTKTNMLPRLDARVEPGRYRVTFWVTGDPPDPSTGLVSQSGSKSVSSRPFIVTN